MNILHVIPNFVPAFYYGGPVQAVWDLCKKLQQLGNRITVVTTNLNTSGVLDVPLKQPVFSDGVEIWYAPVSRLRLCAFSPYLTVFLKNKLKEFDVVHIHTVFNWPGTIAAHFCHKYKVPYIVRPCGMLDPRAVRKQYLQWHRAFRSYVMKCLYVALFDKKNLHNANGLHFTSREEAKAAEHWKLRNRSFVVPLGINVKEYDELRSDRGPHCAKSSDKKTILFLSRLDPKKGLGLLIEALRILTSRRADIRLVIAGSGEKRYEQKIKCLIKKYNLSSHAAFAGFVEKDKKHLTLAQADIFVLPSYQENLGIAVVEAMASGLPVVVSDNVDIHFSIEKYKAGLITHCQPPEIAQAIEKLLDDETLRREMGRNAKKLAEDKFDISNIARQMAGIYESMVTGSR
jgi:glycosyltransferase involved in cell wall biosynthesis